MCIRDSNSGTGKTGTGGSTSGSYTVLSGSYSYMSSPIVLSGEDGNAQTYTAGDYRMNTTYYTSKNGGRAAGGLGPWYGKGGYGRWSTTSTNSSATNGVSGWNGVVIVTEFGDF